MVGGDIYAGSCALDQNLLWRPRPGLPGHRTHVAGLWHIGASTHPGPGLGAGSGTLVAKELLRRRALRSAECPSTATPSSRSWPRTRGGGDRDDAGCGRHAARADDNRGVERLGRAAAAARVRRPDLRTLPALRAGGRFVVNFLREGRSEIARLFASKRDDKFDQVDWRPSASGMPVLTADALAWAECVTVQELEPGDHVILLGQVEEGAALPTRTLR